MLLYMHNIEDINIYLNINEHEVFFLLETCVIFDERLAMSDQVSNIYQKSYFHLRNNTSIVRLLDRKHELYII